jgi:AraC-like DNA-binding protein
MMVQATGAVLNESDIYAEWEPPTGWRHAVACLWEQRVGAARVQRVLPDGHADLLFYGSGEVEIVGVADTVALPALAAGTVLRGVRLRPEAVGAALRIPGFALRNLTMAAEDVLGARSARRLGDPDFLDRWVRGIEPDGRVDATLRLLGAYRVEDVADLLNVSSRHLRRMLLEAVGLGPKAYQQVMRLQRFVTATDGGAPLALAAADAGYADQPHLTREVKRLSGLTPACLVNERRPGRN